MILTLAALAGAAQPAFDPASTRATLYQRTAEPISISEAASPDGTLSLVHETIVDAPVAQVWNAISTADGWKSWAVPVAWLDGDMLETSYAKDAQRGDATTIRQQLVAVVPDRLLLFRTVKAPQGFPNFETFRRVIHVFELEPQGEGRTRVRLTGAGYAATDAGRQLLGFFREGNRMSLEQLRDRFQKGK